jgi:hypothetical protein
MRIRESEECGKSELDLFSIPPTNTQMEESRFDLVKPFSNFKNGTITFKIEGDNQCYIDLSTSELMITCQIMNGETPITDLTGPQVLGVKTGRPDEITRWDMKTAAIPMVIDGEGKVTKGYTGPVYFTQVEVDKQQKLVDTFDKANPDSYLGPVNNFLHSLFSQVQVRIGNTEVENTNSNYPYRAYLESLLCYSKEQKETFLQNEMFYKDTAGSMDDTLFANKGLVARRERYTDQAGVFQMKGRLKSDIFSMNRYILPQVNLQIVLTRANANFCLMGDANIHAKYKDLRIDITEAALQIRRVKVSQFVILQHAMMLDPVRRVIMRCLNTPYMAQSFSLSGIHRGIMPSRVVVAFIDNAAFSGDITRNPFKFINLNIKSLKLKMASVSLPYSDGLTVDYQQNRYMQAYDAMSQNLGNISNDISYKEFGNGYTVYPFDLTPDLCDNMNYNLLRDGALELECVMAKPYDQAFQTLFYLQFENCVEVTKERGVQFDFSIV